MYKIFLVIGITAMLFAVGCEKKSTDSPFSEIGDISLFDNQGNPSDGIDGGQSAYWEFTQLLPNTLYNFVLKNQAGLEMSKARLTTDRFGEIPLTAIGYDIGQFFPGMAKNMIGGGASVETFVLEIYNMDGKLVSSLEFPVDYAAPSVFSADQNGDAINSYLRATHAVYAKGINLNAGDVIRLYVVDDIMFWEDGMAFVDVSGGYETVTANASGELLQMVWSSPSLVAPYDIVADLDENGVLSTGDLVDGYYPVGFMVQVLGTGADIQVQIACDLNYEYKDFFQVNENVYAYLNPRTQQFTHKWVHKYVVVHQDQWNNGDPLNDVTEGPELDTPQYGCTNEGRILIWPAMLTPGKYDIVIDVDRNGIYDKGIDFLDNIDSYGLPTAGFVVGMGNNPPVVTILQPEDGLETADEIVYLVGTVSDTSIHYAKLIVNGASKTITVINGALEYTPIILQRGWNLIRVEAHNQNGLGFDEADVKGTFPAYGMKITLTWDVGPYNDVDMHIQDPTGEWCWYGHMNTTIGGWLDVDDTNGWGPENFRLTQEAVNAHPGVYNVKVHYYDDAGEGPTVPTIKIVLNEGLGNQIERTMVGPALNQEGDWWYVTSIHMPAGTFSDYVPVGAAAKKPDLPKKLR